MNEEFLNQLYLETGMEKEGISESQFSELLLNNEELRTTTYGELGFEKEGGSIEDFNSLLGLKKKEPTASTSSAGESPSKEVCEEVSEEKDLVPFTKEVDIDGETFFTSEDKSYTDTLYQMQDPNDAVMPSEDRMSLGQKDQQALELKETVDFQEPQKEYVDRTLSDIYLSLIHI